MTQVSFTSGELLDIISALEIKESKFFLDEDFMTAAYYQHLIQQFEKLNDKLQERPGEERVANLVLAA
jgi:hypothetical protein